MLEAFYHIHPATNSGTMSEHPQVSNSAANWWAAGGPAIPPNYPTAGELFQESDIFKMPQPKDSKILPALTQTSFGDFNLTPLEELKRPILRRSGEQEESASRDNSPGPSKKPRDSSPGPTKKPRKRRSRGSKDPELLPGHYFFPYQGRKYMIPDGTIVYPYSSIC